MRFKIVPTFFLASLIGLPQAALAGWNVVTGDSGVRFVSVKKSTVAETHHFDGISGVISDTGEAQLNIELETVDTGIPIRNQRLQTMLFKTGQYPRATITASIDSEKLAALGAGESYASELVLDLSLAGKTRSEQAQVQVTGLADGRTQVTTTAPILINAADYGLVPGIEKLRQVAGLDSISPVVPINFHLVLAQD